jgi:hypothetical protein
LRFVWSELADRPAECAGHTIYSPLTIAAQTFGARLFRIGGLVRCDR